MAKRSWIVRGALGLAASMFMAASAYAHDIHVALDATTPLRLSSPAQGVSIGNSSIIGVSVQSDRLLFVTGRSYGTTNLVVVDGDGRTIYSGRVTVTPDENGAVIVTRGLDTERLECSPICRPRPDIGDGSDAFGQVTSQIGARASTGTGGGN